MSCSIMNVFVTRAIMHQRRNMPVETYQKIDLAPVELPEGVLYEVGSVQTYADVRMQQRSF